MVSSPAKPNMLLSALVPVMVSAWLVPKQEVAPRQIMSLASAAPPHASSTPRPTQATNRTVFLEAIMSLPHLSLRLTGSSRVLVRWPPLLVGSGDLSGDRRTPRRAIPWRGRRGLGHVGPCT